MNKKGIIKIGAVITLITIALTLISLTLLSSATIEDTYEVGETIKIGLPEKTESTIKIKTPSETFIKKTSGNSFSLRLEEKGQYIIDISSEEEKRRIELETITKEEFNKTNEVPNKKSNNPTIQNEKTKLGDKTNLSNNESLIKVGHPVKNKKRMNVSSNEDFEIKVPSNAQNISIKSNKSEEIEYETKSSLFSVFSNPENKSLVVNNVEGEIEVEYYTSPPEKEETEISKSEKRVKISSEEGLHYENVFASTNITESLKLSQKDKIKIYWEEENIFLDFEVVDKNQNGFIDEIQWIVPHLSEQNFEILIEITDANHLDENRNFIENIYDFVKEKDNLWKTIPEDDFVRVSFEEELDSENDITIYARSSQNSTINVYEKNSSNILTSFENINQEKEYKIFLTSLENPQKTFDLEIIGGDIEFDYIVDPSWQNESWTNRKNITIPSSNIQSDLTNFPLLVELYDEDLKASRPDGFDIYFTDDNNNKLSHEIEFYDQSFNSTHSHLIAWVKTNLSSSTDNTIWMYYNNSDSVNQENPLDVWDSNFVAVQHLEEDCGTTNCILDSTSNSNHGTPSSGGTNTNLFDSSGLIDGAISTDGSDDYVELGLTNMPSSNEPMTLEAWAYYSGTPGTENLVLVNDQTGAAVQLGFRNTAVTTWLWGGSTIVTSSLPGADSWHHYVFTTDGTNHELYVDGVQTDTSTVSLQSGSTTEARINTDAWSENFGGTIDEARFSNIPRSADWINTSYQNQINPQNFYSVGIQEVLETSSFPPNITINSPSDSSTISDPTPYLNLTLNGTANTLWYNLNDGENKTICGVCSGAQTTPLHLSEGSHTLNVYANISNGNESFEQSSFNLNLNNHFFDSFEDDNSIDEMNNVTWSSGSVSFTGEVSEGNIEINEPSVETFSGTEGTTHTIDLSTASEGDVRSCIIAGNPDGTGATGTMIVPNGWTEVGTQTETGAASTGMLTIIYRVVQSGDGNTLGLTYDNPVMVASVCTTYEGVDTSNVLDASVPSFNTGNSPPISPSITTQTDNAMLVYAALVDGNPTWDDGSIPGGSSLLGTMSNNPPSNGQNLGAAYEVQQNAGSSGTTNWNDGGNEEYVAATFALRPAPIPGPTGNLTSKQINTTDTITQISNITWDESNTDGENNNVTIQLSANNGQSWSTVENGKSFLDLVSGKSLLFRAIFDTNDSRTISLNNIEINWSNDPVPPPQIQINSPLESSTFSKITTDLNLSLNKIPHTLLYSLDGGTTNKTLCSDCDASQINSYIYLSEGSKTLTVFANDSANRIGSNSSSFTVDFDFSFYENFNNNRSLKTMEEGINWLPGNLTFSTKERVSFFDNFDDGDLGNNWTTYSSNSFSRIGVRTEDSFSGSYSVIADSNTDGNYELSELITNKDFSEAEDILLSFYFREFDSDEDDAGSDHTGHQNADAVYYTCDGNQWYHLQNLFGTTSWQQVNINVSSDSNFCPEVNSSFAIKFTQYDNYDFNLDGIGWDDINITYIKNSPKEVISHSINTSSQILEFTNISWNEFGTDSENTLSVQVSVDNGNNWYNATNKEELAGFSQGNKLLYKLIFDTNPGEEIGITDLSINWTDTASPPANFTIHSPAGITSDPTPLLNVTLDSQANSLWYNIDGGENKLICNLCSGNQNTFLQLSEGQHTINVYTNNSAGDENSEQINIDVDFNFNYFDNFTDTSSISSLNKTSWNSDKITLSSKRNSFFSDFDDGDLGNNWATYSSNSFSRIGVRTEDSFSGTYSVIADSNTDGNYELSELITNKDFTGAEEVFLSFYYYDFEDENDGGSDHTGHENADAVYYTCDGNQWYHLQNLFGTTSWQQVNINISADSNFCSTVDENFAIKFTQYDNYALTTDGIGWDDINISYTTPEISSIMSYPINTSDYIVEFTNISWNEEISGEESNIGLSVSSDGGNNWYNATNNQGLTGIASGKSLIYKINFNAAASENISINDLNISWNNIIVPPPNITLNSPQDSSTIQDPTPYLNLTLNGTANTLWFTKNSGNPTTICKSCTGTLNFPMLLSEGDYDLDIYANNSIGTTSSIQSSFSVDFNKTFSDTFDDNTSIKSLKDGTEWREGNMTFLPDERVSFFDNFDDGDLGNNWTTYSSNSFSRIGVRTEDSFSGTYSVIADSNTDGNYELSELITNKDFSEAEDIFLSFYYYDFEDENDGGSDHTGHENADAVYYTCDGNQWYHLQNLFGTTAWQQVNINISADSNFCSEVNSSFAIKFTQYDNFEATTDGIGWDDINISYTLPKENYFISHTINTTQNIKRITNISWNEFGTDSENTLSVQVSVDNGNNWYNATNNQGLSGFSEDNNLAYRVNASLTNSIVSLLDMEITWAEPPSPKIHYPETYVYNHSISELNYSINIPSGSTLDSCWYSLDGGNTTIPTTCNQNITGLSSNEGNNTWIVYANDTEGATGFDSVTFIVDTNAPNITFINQTNPQGEEVNNSNPLNAGENLSINVEVNDSNTENVWIVVWEGVKGGAERVKKALTYAGGALWFAMVETDNLWENIYSYTIYANDSSGFESEYDGNFSVQQMYMNFDINPNPSIGTGNLNLTGKINLTDGTGFANQPLNLWYEGELLTLDNLTANGNYQNYKNFTDENSNDFNEGTFDQTQIQSEDLILSSGSSKGNYTKTLDAGAIVEWNSIFWQSTGNSCSGVLTYQEGDSSGYSGTRDTYVDGNTPSTNYGTSQNLLTDTNPEQRALIKFEEVLGYGLNKIPYDATINNANITVQIYDGGDNPTAYEILEEWEEDYANYNVRLPSTSWSESGVSAFPSRSNTAEDTFSGGAGSTVFDISSAMQSWSDQSTQNNGIVLHPGGTNNLGIRSSEYSTQSQRPLLSVDFNSNDCTTTRVYFRTSNDKQSWSEWQQTTNTESLSVHSRYLEYRVELSSIDNQTTPELHEISANYTAVVTDSNGNFNYAFPSPQVFGTYDFKASSGYKTLYDEETEELDVQSGVSPQVDLMTSNNKWFNNSNFNLTYSVNDLNDNIQNSSLIINGNLNQTNQTEILNGQNNSFEISNFPQGGFNWTVNVTDSSGLTGTDSQRTFYVDLEDPEISLIYPGNNTSYNYDQINLSFNASDNLDSSLTCDVVLDGNSIHSGISANNSQITNVSSGFLSNGQHFWNVTCFDNSLRQTSSETFEFTISDTPPTVNLTLPENNAFDDDGNVSFVFYPQDNSGFQSCDLIFNGTVQQSNQSAIINNQNNTINQTGLSEGNIEWTVGCYDLSSSYHEPNPRNLTIDLNAPQINLNQPSDSYISDSSSVNFNFTITDTIDETLSCSINLGNEISQDFNATSGNLTNVLIENITDGTKKWNVTCTDDAGHTNTSASRQITISEPPTISLSTQNESAFSSGTATFSYIPNDNTGINSCDIYFNDAFQQSNSTPINLGQQNNMEVTSISDGVYEWYMNCSDSSGISNTSEKRIFYMDSNPPQVDLVSPLGDDIYASNITFNFTATDSIDSSVLCNITVDSQVEDSNFNAINNSITSRTVSGISDGYHDWQVSCSDSSGNSNTSSTSNFTKLTTPELYLVNPDDNHWFNTQSFNLTYFTQDDEGIVNSSLYINSILNKTNQTEILNGQNNSFEISNFPQGEFNWSVQVYDTTGLGESTSERTFYVDLENPEIFVYSPNGSEIVETNNVTFNFTTQDNLAENISCQIYLDGENEYNQTSSNSSNFINNLLIVDGNHSWQTTCSDLAGNEITSQTFNFTVEAPPEVTLNSPSNDYRTNDSQIDFVYTPSDPIGITECSLYLDGNLNQTSSSIAANTQNNFTVSGINEGEHNWTVGCTDPDFNTEQAQENTFYRDLTPPNIILENPENNSGIDFNNNQIFFTWKAIDELDVAAQCDLYIDGNLEESTLVSNNVSNTESVSTSSIGQGFHNWYVECSDYGVGNTNTSQTNFFNLTYPDFEVLNSEIYFNTTEPKENEPVNITATINNLEGADINDVVIEFYLGDPDSTGTQIGSDITTNISKFESKNVSIEWNSELGTSEIYVVVDYENLFTETNESNNKASKNISVGSWQFFYGDISSSSEFELAANGSGRILSWSSDSFDSGNVYVTDYESFISWNELQAIGKDSSGSNSSNDFSEIDSGLEMSSFTDSIEKLFSNSGDPNQTESFQVFKKQINDVPVTNSIESENFKTGILWDVSDDTNSEYDSTEKEDLVFVGKINKQTQGTNGIYDYEIRVPAKLREYYNSVDDESVVFYVELS